MSGYRVVIKGREVTAETLDALDALLDRYPGASGSSESAEKHSPHGGKSGPEGRWPQSRFKDFTGRLTPPQLRMLQEVVKSQHGKTAKDLAQILGFRDAKVFGPLMAAMSKHAKKTGVRVQDVLTTERIDVGDGDKVTQFKATESFTRAAMEAGWSRLAFDRGFKCRRHAEYMEASGPRGLRRRASGMGANKDPKD